MSVISFKEATMLLLGFGLVYSLFYLRTHDELFPKPTIRKGARDV